MKLLKMYFNDQILEQTTQQRQQYQQQKVVHIKKRANKKISINELHDELVEKNFKIYDIEFYQSILNFSLFARRRVQRLP